MICARFSCSCVLAISNKPGEVATKHSVAFGEELLRHTGESLGRDLSLEGSGYEPKAFQAPKETPKGKHMSFGDAADDEDVEGSEQETVGAGSVPVSDASVWRSGDDLGDDFALFSSEGDGKKTKKKGF